MSKYDAKPPQCFEKKPELQKTASVESKFDTSDWDGDGLELHTTEYYIFHAYRWKEVAMLYKEAALLRHYEGEDPELDSLLKDAKDLEEGRT